MVSGCSGTSGDGLSSGKGDGCLRTLLRFSGNAAAPPVTTTQRVSRQLATWVSPVGGLRTLGAIRRDLPSLSSTASASARPLAGFLRLHRRQKLVATSAAASPGAWTAPVAAAREAARCRRRRRRVDLIGSSIVSTSRRSPSLAPSGSCRAIPSAPLPFGAVRRLWFVVHVVWRDGKRFGATNPTAQDLRWGTAASLLLRCRVAAPCSWLRGYHWTRALELCENAGAALAL